MSWVLGEEEERERWMKKVEEKRRREGEMKGKTEGRKESERME